jgi:general secretion pathway protein E
MITLTSSPAPINLDSVIIDPRWAMKVPPETARRRLVLPFYAEPEGPVHVAAADPTDEATARALERTLGREVLLCHASTDSLQRAHRRVFGEHSHRRPQISAPASADDFVQQTDRLIDAAALREASDIHLEPGEQSVRLRYRVHGHLVEADTYNAETYAGITSRLKILARLDISEKRIPQDGQITLTSTSTGRRYSIRMATIPTRHGEKITLRFLGLHASSLTLADLGMDAAAEAAFTTAINRPHGLVVLTGPTGSGKTSTMYAALRHLQSHRPDAIITIEDPVECDLPGITQVEVDGERLDYPQALRSVLRHDPDVILIGEIRDAESANIAVRAALTGHLVLSTLHTHSAIGAITRLLDLGVEPYLLGSTLHCVAAQRLVRRLCPACRRTDALSEREALGLRRPEAVGGTIYRAVGCPYCGDSGYNGRHAIYEILPLDDSLCALVAEQASENDLLTAARKQGHRSLREQAHTTLLRGLSSPEEVLKALG